jgi:ferredoxin
MKIQKIFLSALFSVIGSFVFTASAFASVTPTISAVGYGDGDRVTVTVNADPSASVLMYYTKTGVGPQLTYIGTTNSSGYLSVIIRTTDYVVASGSAVHVLVNNLQSSDVAWPYGSSTTTTSSITLSQTGMVLNVGGSSTITATGSSSLYLSNNSNSSIANVSISGNSITITGNKYGQTVVTVCPQSSSSNCPSVYVTVQSSGVSALTFSQSNITIAYGQSVPVTVSGGTGVYTILNNSNSGNVSASLSSSTVTLNALQSSGSSSITVCSSDISSCGIINVTIGTSSTATLYFSQTSPVISTGQTLNITLSGGGSSSYYLSSNSSTSVVQATVSGSTLTLYGILSGTSNVTVCSSVGSCNSLAVTVSYVSTGGPITLSQNSVSLLVGQSLSITVSGGSSPYSLSSNSGNIFQSTLSGNIITLYGVSIGSSTVAVCSSEGACITLSVTVTSASSSTAGLTFSQSSLSLTSGQSQSVTVSGTGGYYISGNTNSSVATASISGSTITVSGVGTGSTNISVCQSGGSCSILYVWVNSGSTTTTSLPTTFLTFSKSNPTVAKGSSTAISIYGTSSSTYYVAYNSSSSIVQTSVSGANLTISGSANGCAVVVICSSNSVCGAVSVTVGTTAATTTTKYTFSGENITVGSSGDAVTELQQRLKNEGYFTGSVTGYYGALTANAVRSYQKAKGISQTGTVGPLTMAELNK